MVAQKAIFRFLNKSQLQSNKVCYKVSLFEDFQWQSCISTLQKAWIAYAGLICTIVLRKLRL